MKSLPPNYLPQTVSLGSLWHQSTFCGSHPPLVRRVVRPVDSDLTHPLAEQADDAARVLEAAFKNGAMHHVS